jgi:hypothetical protein
MSLPVAIGIDDFRALRERGLAYVDKSNLIRELLDAPGIEVVLLPRPRRFGKSLNLSMLRCWFERREEDLSHLFADLSIWQAGEAYRAHFQRYPVIHLTLKGTKGATFEECWGKIREKIVDLFEAHRHLLDSGRLDDVDERRFRQILDGTAERALYARALFDLSAHLHAHHGEKVVILLDEYDEPIHSGYANGYARPILDFMRGLFIDGLKGNPHLYRAVVTGVLRVSKESLFSGANNIAVYTLLRSEFATSFGFTEPEVASLLERAGRSALLDEVRGYYNGYSFGGTAVYNPWSILSFLADPHARLRPYWVKTSSNELVHEALRRHAFGVQREIETLLEGGAVARDLDEDIALDDLATRASAVFSLLVFSGYLRAEEVPGESLEIRPYALSIPNREVRSVYTSTFRDLLREQLGDESAVDRLERALLGGDAEALEEELGAFTKTVLSYHDTARRPEQVYHAFVIGLLATLDPEYEVRSNRESGKGRPDVMVRPRRAGKPGAVLELKVAKPGKKTLDEALAEGAAQIRDRDYASELRAAGASPVHAFAVAFDGKDVRVVGV